MSADLISSPDGLPGGEEASDTGAAWFAWAAWFTLATVALWFVAYVVGPGFSIGADTTVHLVGGQLGEVPALPMFAKLELFSLLGVAGILELVGGALLILGLFTRPVAFILSGQMAVAYWMSHGPRAFHPLLNGGEAAILFCFIFLYIAAAGPGPWSIDAARRK